MFIKYLFLTTAHTKRSHSVVGLWGWCVSSYQLHSVCFFFLKCNWFWLLNFHWPVWAWSNSFWCISTHLNAFPLGMVQSFGDVQTIYRRNRSFTRFYSKMLYKLVISFNIIGSRTWICLLSLLMILQSWCFAWEFWYARRVI